MAEYGGSSTYAPGSSTTTVQTRPGAYDPTEALLALLARERTTLDNRIPAAAPVAPAPRMAVAPVPVQQPQGQTQTRAAASALADRQSETKYPIYRKMIGGPNTVPGWVNVDEAEPGAVFAGYRSTPPPGKTTIAETGNISDHMKSRDQADLSLNAQATAASRAPIDSRGGSDFARRQMDAALTRSNSEYDERQRQSGGR